MIITNPKCTKTFHRSHNWGITFESRLEEKPEKGTRLEELFLLRNNKEYRPLCHYQHERFYQIRSRLILWKLIMWSKSFFWIRFLSTWVLFLLRHFFHLMQMSHCFLQLVSLIHVTLKPSWKLSRSPPIRPVILIKITLLHHAILAFKSFTLFGITPIPYFSHICWDESRNVLFQTYTVKTYTLLNMSPRMQKF